MVSREELYELVWSIPMTKVAEKFSVSGSYMARVCSVLNVPHPERGYWAKLEVGKAPASMKLFLALTRMSELLCTKSSAISMGRLNGSGNQKRVALCWQLVR